MAKKKNTDLSSYARKRKNEVIREAVLPDNLSDEMFLSLFALLPQATILTNDQFLILNLNLAAGKLLNKGVEELEGESVFSFLRFRSATDTEALQQLISNSPDQLHTFANLKVSGQSYSIVLIPISLMTEIHYLIQMEVIHNYSFDSIGYDLNISSGNDEMSLLSSGIAEPAFFDTGNSFLRTIADSLPHPFYIIEAGTNKAILKNKASVQFESSLASVHCFMSNKLVRCAGDPYTCPLSMVNASTSPIRVEHEFITKSGEKLIHEVFGYPVFSIKGGLNYVIQYSLDITERKRSEIELAEYQGTLDNLMNNLPGMAFRCLNESNWTMEYVSPGCKKLTGYSSSDLINNKKTHYGDLILDEDRKMVWNKIQNALKFHRFYKVEYRIVTKNGKIKWVLEQGRGVYDKFENLVRLEGLVTDVTEVKKAELRLKNELAINQGIATIGLELLSDTIRPERVAYMVQSYVRQLTGSAFSLLISPSSEEEGSYYYCFEEADENELSKRIKKHEKKQAKADDLLDKLLSGHKPVIINESDIKIKIPCVPPGRFTFNRLLSVPAFINNQYAGVLLLANCEQDFTEETVMLVQRYINMYALASYRLKAEESLQLAKEKAEASDQLKSLFLSNMSHEIRTPMNAILGFAEMLQDPELNIEEKDRFLDVIIKSGDNLLRLINDIIDISKIESGQLRIIYSDCYLNELFADLDELYNTELNLLRKSHLTFYIQTGKVEPDFAVYTDPVRLRQIITNLVGNAIKFTDEGFIELGYRVRGEKVEFYVRDSGIGIPVDQQKLIFDRFGQVKEVAVRNLTGTGLGLTISKNLVELLGGTMWLDSFPGEGSTFWFSIPLKVGNHRSETLFETDISLAQQLDLGGKNILVVEDVDTNYFYISSLLLKLNVKIQRAEDGAIAIEMVKNDPSINLVLMDIELPVMDGYTATREIKKIRPGLPVIAQTAFAMMGEREKSLEAGCDDYIAKPIRKEILLEVISKFI
jgi:PAS domain S-box-containing protein